MRSTGKRTNINSESLLHLSHISIEKAVDGILWLDSEGRICRANEAASRQLGYTKEELSELTIPDIDPDCTLEDYNERYWKNIRKTGFMTFESRNQRKDGSIYPVEVTCYFVELDGDGYICTFLRDISDRKEIETALRDSEGKLRAILNNHYQFTGLLDTSGRLLMANETALNFIGAEESDVVGKYFYETPWWAHSKELQSKLRQAINKAAHGDFIRFETTHLDVEGNKHVLDFSLKPLRDEEGNVTYLIPESRDITDIKKTEEALQQTLKELESLKDRLQEENVYLQEEIRVEYNFGEIIGQSSAIKQVLRQVEHVAPTETTVLILGETGTGKELVARALHDMSARRQRPLVKVNCAAIPATLIESEFFGHEKGAFTGAVARKVGRFELADGGTIFLDEIGDLPLELQAKLLRVLQEGEFERLGSPETIKVDVRLIVATNRDLAELIKKGNFREDLFYRINVFPIVCPPLRERKDDIPLLVKHFIDKYSAKTGKAIETVSQKTMHDLQGYSWPGNVRELENVIERAMVLSRSKRLEVGEWFFRVSAEPRPSEMTTLEENERRHILKALELTGWRVSGEKGAARILGINSQTLTSRMKKLGIKR